MVATVSVGAVVLTAVPSPAAPSCGATEDSERAAIATAAACEQPVAVEPSRSEYVQVVAQPDGRLQFESAVEPQRTRRDDGSWTDVDLTLRIGADGQVRPVASVADVAFSGGGDRPMVELRRGGKSLSFSWPGRLPTPRISGDSATYVDVFGDTDLVLRATRTGFTHVLVLKTRQAAADPAVRAITLRRAGDASISRLPGGELQATVDGTIFAQTEPAIMWDSSLPSGVAPASTEARMASSDATTAGDGARIAPVETEVTEDGHLRLLPDAELLDSSEATFPIFVDPAWDVARTKWAYGTSNNCTNTDYSTARVGYSPEGPCTDVRFRSYFQFPTTNGKVSLKKKYIHAAYVRMTLEHSWSCDSTRVNMYLTPVINATMKASFSSMALKSHLAAASGHANKGSGCSDSPQADMPMNFESGTFLTQVRTAADDEWNSITVGFSARDADGTDESAQGRWKKFAPGKAKLVVDYDSKPGKPTGLQVARVACPTSGVISIGTLTPTFGAVYPDADAGQTLTGTYEWIEVPASGMGSVTDTSPTRRTPPNRASATAGGLGITTQVSVVKDKTYAFRLRTTDPAPYNRTSEWSGWCQFKVDTTRPPVEVSVLTPPSGPGTPVTVRITSSHTDVTQFKYGWTGPTTVVAASGSPKSATVTLTVPKYGQNTLFVSAVDVTLNEGSGSHDIVVARPSPPVAHWGLETYPGQTQPQALEDRQPALSLNTPLSPSNLTWTEGSRLVGGQVATFNGTSTQAITSQPAVNTAGSFSVAAWLKVDSYQGCASLSAISADGTISSGFVLEYDCAADRFRMRVPDKDGGILVDATSTVPTAIQRWTHVAGVWDEVERQVKLYVDGKLVSTVTPSAAWLTSRGGGYTATGALVVGRSRSNSANQHFFKGEIADVQIFDRVLLEQDFLGAMKDDPFAGGVDEPGFLAPVLVGRWDFGVARSCYLQDLPDTCDAMDGTGFGRWLALQRGAEIGAGNRDNGLRLDGFYFPEENAEPWEVTREFGRSAYKTGVTVDGDGNEKTVWANTPVLRTDQSFTVSIWANLDRTDVNQVLLVQDGIGTAGFYLYYSTDNGGVWRFKILNTSGTPDNGSGANFANAPAQAAADSWHHVVAVLDVGRRQMRMYADGELKNTTSLSSSWQPWQATGPLAVGQSFNGWDPLYGAVDDISVYQGAMTDAQVSAIYAAEAVEVSSS
ncbi:LamG domain-containing protein [Verrucosispora sp. TAA-831]|uniref:LamG domain-containing protein n=1 Tax=Verrucosispora sp. TAA-831 TaxID=3422227 RepID=UPI003D6F7273